MRSTTDNGLSKDARVLLWAAIEDAGLWEMPWELNTARPDRTSEANLAIAREEVAHLLELGYVEIYETRESGTPGVPADRTPGAQVLVDERAWLPSPLGHRCFRVRATMKGEVAYNALSR